MSILNVYAENAIFYEAEYIDDIYMSKYEYSTNTIYYQKARFFRKETTNEFAYCIEPFNFFVEGSIYDTTDHINKLNEYQIDRIKKIAHFGYGYKDHTDSKWYAITQMMIWIEAGSNQGDFYFTDTLNGNRIEPFNNEIQEINNLINYYNTNPIDENYVHKFLEGSSMGIFAGTNISNYESDSENIFIKKDTLGIKNLKEGYYEFTLTRNEDENNPIIFYKSDNSQTLMEYGGLQNKTCILRVQVIKGSLTINKLDEETENTPQGEASLDGAIYGLYNNNDKLLKELIIENNTTQIDSIRGNYYIQEITPGTGYNLDTEKYPINITIQNPNIELNLTNKVIKKNINIKKLFGEENNLLGEENISFEIYNNKNEIINTITTNELGEASINLPYGTYTFKQINTTEGYEYSEDFKVIVDNNEDENIEIIDYKINVPNTYIVKKNILSIIIEYILLLIC